MPEGMPKAFPLVLRLFHVLVCALRNKDKTNFCKFQLTHKYLAMAQIIIRRMTLTDLICNIFYKIRFWFYRNFYTDVFVTVSYPEEKDLEMTFQDDFDTISWSGDGKGTLWETGEGWGQFHPDYPYTYSGPPELVKGVSCARFNVVYDPKTFPDDHRTGNPITIAFRKSHISTHKSFKQTYGRFECRCNIPFDKGAWPAFWLWGVTEDRYSEIDIFELFGARDGDKAGTQEINMHYGEKLKTPYETIRSWPVKIDRPSKINFFHEFAMEWTPKKIELFTDGVKIFRYSRRKILEKWFSSPMWIVQNHAINHKYVKQEDKDYYSEYLVDYVRAYKLKN